MFTNSFIEALLAPRRRCGSWDCSQDPYRSRRPTITPRGSALDRPGVSVLLLVQLDIEAERTQFLDQHVERLGDAGLEVVVAADDRLVDLGAAGHVVRLHRQHLLRSEEHTSELQSLMRNSYAVFCLKKKNNQLYNICTTNTRTLTQLQPYLT